jgi:glycosyltransferase involved in cell wall biosynthesis
MRIVVVMPAHNEDQTIARVITHIRRVLPDAQVVVVDDLSTDHTAVEATRAGAKVLRLTNNLGYGGAVQTGLRYAWRQGYDVAVQMDADGQHDPDDLPKVLAPVLANEADVATGSRFLGRADYAISVPRRIGMKMFSWLASSALQRPITDPTTGFQCHGRRVLRHFAVSQYHSDYLNSDTMIMLAFQGFRIIEVPVVMKERVAGISMFHGGLKPILYVAKMFLSILVVVLREKVLKPERRAEA